MKKIIRIIHINSLIKKDIFEVYYNLNDCKCYDLSSSGLVYLSKNFWEMIKYYCLTGKISAIDETNDKSTIYENLVLVDVSSRSSDDKLNEFAFADIPYLLAFLFQLEEQYTLCFYNCENITNKSNNYFRLSHFLNLWAAQTKKIKKIKYLDITEEIGEQEFNPRGLAYQFKHESPSETLLPIISLTKEMYQCLEYQYSVKNNASLNELLQNMKRTQSMDYCYDYYVEYIKRAIGKMLNNEKPIKWKEKEEKFLLSNPSLIVVYMYAMIVSHISYDELLKIGFEQIVEKCFDYSQGLMQLLENSIKHVVNEEEQSCAFFSIRMHHQQGAIDDYLENEEFKKIDYYLEISALDCCKNSLNPGIIAKYNNILIENGLGCIEELRDIFEHSSVLDEYYNDVSNISNHYGLQIFDTTLTTNYGLFIVKSGDTSSPKIYTNANKVFYEDKRIYKAIDEKTYHKNHFCGTNYTIILPIIKNQSKSIVGNLSLGNIPLDFDEDFEYVETTNMLPLTLKRGKKEVFIDKYILEINKMINEKTNIISFSINDISKSRIQLELFCKAIFSFIASNERNISVVCLLDVENEYSLLDAIRIIALFYNKTGNCKFMENKGIYIASADNEYDVLFTGNSINSVLENIERQRLMKSLPESFYNHILYALDRRNGEGSYNE